jgi:hypothetical protein
LNRSSGDPFFNDAALTEQPRARLENQRVHQILGSFGKSAMTDKKVADLVIPTRQSADYDNALSNEPRTPVPIFHTNPRQHRRVCI